MSDMFDEFAVFWDSVPLDGEELPTAYYLDGGGEVPSSLIRQFADSLRGEEFLAELRESRYEAMLSGAQK
jgi:hypothetical protein